VVIEFPLTFNEVNPKNASIPVRSVIALDDTSKLVTFKTAFNGTRLSPCSSSYPKSNNAVSKLLFGMLI